MPEEKALPEWIYRVNKVLRLIVTGPGCQDAVLAFAKWHGSKPVCADRGIFFLVFAEN